MGDEAILRAMLEQIGRSTSLRPFVFGWRPENVTRWHGVASLDPHRARRLAVIWALLRARVLILGGGGLIKDYGGSPRSLARWLRWLEVAQQLGVPTMTWSVGVDELVFPASRERARRVLSRVDALTVRDRESAERLRELGIDGEIAVTADPVHGLLLPERRRQRPGEPPRVVICLRHWYVEHNEIRDSATFARLLEELAEACDRLYQNHGASITFAPFRTASGDDDRLVAREVMSRMDHREVLTIDDQDPSVEQILRVIAGADVVIAMRLHAAIIATSMGIPTTAIAYAPKVRDFMASLGAEDYCSSVEAVSSRWLVEKTAAVLESGHHLAGQLAAETRAKARALEVNLRLFEGLVDRRKAYTRFSTAPRSS